MKFKPKIGDTYFLPAFTPRPHGSSWQLTKDSEYFAEPWISLGLVFPTEVEAAKAAQRMVEAANL